MGGQNDRHQYFHPQPLFVPLRLFVSPIAIGLRRTIEAIGTLILTQAPETISTAIEVEALR